MFIKSWGEVIFDIAMGTGMYFAGRSNGKTEVQQQWNNYERDKQIDELKRQIEELRKEKI